MNTPAQCQNMEDIRAEIDRLDEHIISTLGERFGYVKAAAKFKKSEEAVKAPQRFASMLEQRRVWAIENGLSADVIEQLYRDLVGYFIAQETAHWQEKRKEK